MTHLLEERLQLELQRVSLRETTLREDLARLSLSALEKIQTSVRVVSEVVEEESRKRFVLSEIHKDAKSLASTASALCDRVRLLDTTLRNLKTAKQFVSGLEALKDVDEQLRVAVEAGEVAKGAMLVTRVRKFEKAGFSSALDRRVFQRYKEFETKLLRVLREELSSAVKDKNSPQVEAFVKTLFAVGLEKDAVEIYFEFVRSGFSERCQAKIPPTGNDQTPVHVEAVTDIFLHVADVIQKHEQYIASEFGDDHFGDFLQQIEYEANAHAVRVMRALMKNTSIAQQQVSKDSSEFTVRTLDFCLEELVTVVMRCKRFGTYMSQLRGTVSSASIGSLQQVLEEVAGAYVAGEQALLSCLLEKAAKEEEVDLADSVSYTALVDDAFFIFKKALDRSVLTTDSNCACAVVNNISNLVQVDLKELLEARFEQSKRLFPNLTLSEERLCDALLKLKAQTTDPPLSVITSAESLPHALGNVVMASVYLGKFKQDCLETYDKNFRDSERRVMFMQCVSGLDLVANELNELHLNGVKYLLQSVRGVYITPFLGALDSVNFDLSEAGFNEMQVNDPFMRAFLASLDSLVRWISQVVVPETAGPFLSMLCDYIARSLEKFLLQSKSKFSFLGATHMYQDVAKLVAFFAENTEVAVKTKFGRIQELCSLLCLESLSEFAQIYPQGCEGAGPLLAARITPADVRALLSLRSEFSHDAIATSIIF